MLVADFLPSDPAAREALAARFTRILTPAVQPDIIAEIVVKVGALVADYKSYKRCRDEYHDSEVWRAAERVRDASGELLQALRPFLDASPFSPGGSGAVLLGIIELGRAAPSTWCDPFVARLKALHENAERAAKDLHPTAGLPGNRDHRDNKRVEVTKRALKFLPASVPDRTRNAYVGLVFDLADEPVAKVHVRKLVSRAIGDADDAGRQPGKRDVNTP